MGNTFGVTHVRRPYTVMPIHWPIALSTAPRIHEICSFQHATCKLLNATYFTYYLPTPGGKKLPLKGILASCGGSPRIKNCVGNLRRETMMAIINGPCTYGPRAFSQILKAWKRRVSEEVLVMKAHSRTTRGEIGGGTVETRAGRPRWERRICLCGSSKLSKGGPDLWGWAGESGTTTWSLRTRGLGHQTQVYPSTL